MAEFLVIVFTILSLVFLRRALSFNPLVLFIAFNGIFSCSIIVGLNPESSVDQLHGYIYVLASFALLVYSALIFDQKNYRRNLNCLELIEASTLSKKYLGKTIQLFAFSTGISIFYYVVVVRNNLFVPALLGADIDFTTLRLDMYSSRFTFAGFFNQFKNTILPISYSVLIFCSTAKRGQWRKILFIIYFPLFLWLILGTGQRTFLMMSLAGFGYSYLHVNKKKRNILVISGVVITFIVFFGIVSSSQGRTNLSDGPVDFFVSTINGLFERIFSSNQLAAIEGFRYISSKERIPLISEWLATIIGFLPGIPGSTLSNEIFDYIFGGFRGTAPLSLWGSVYHNVGLIGIFPVALILAKLIELSQSLIRVLPINLLTVTTICFLYVLEAIVPLTPPFQILNNGLFGIIFIFILSKYSLKLS